MLFRHLALTFGLLLTISPISRAQTEFQPSADDLRSIYRISLTIPPKSYKGVFRDFRSNVYHPATILLENGDSLHVKVRVRGDSSRDLDKKSLKIKLGDTEYFLTESNKVNLNAEASDKTYMRQHLATVVYAESGQPAFQTKHIELHINNEFQGIYLWIESMDDHFLKRAGLDPNGNLYKATFDGATLSSHDNLYNNWEKKTNRSDESIDDLVKLQNEINSIPDEDYYDWARSTFDYDNLINSLAVNMLISNSSTYYHNYYLYHNLETNKWYYLPWDMDETFVVEYSTMHYQRGSWAERKSAEMEGNPILERAIIDQKILKDIQARITELQKAVFNIDNLGPKIDSLASMLAPFIGKEKIVSHHISLFDKEIKEIKTFIERRYADLQKQFKENPTSFRIHQPEGAFDKEITLTWESSIDPNNDDLLYTIRYSRKEDFDEGVRHVRDVKGTHAVFSSGKLRSGKYFFTISVSDGNEIIYGYHSKNFFLVSEDSE